MVDEFRFGDALAVCVFLSEHEPAGDRGSRARARLVARITFELRLGLDHLDQLHTWAEILPDPVAVAGIGRLCDQIDRAQAQARRQACR